jgi:hypothetical protein
MHPARLANIVVTWAAFSVMGIPLVAEAQDMPAREQNALVRRYCATCHTDAARNGGLSLEHYDAARIDPALAAMLLSKLRNGAMGASGLPIPDPPTRDAWVAATKAQAEGAGTWTVTRTEPLAEQGSSLTASIVRQVQPRKPNTDSPLYRLIVRCEGATRRGEMQLTWSPEPQTDRMFLVSGDGRSPVAHTLAGKETMGNGSSGTSGRASATLQAPLPATSLSIVNLFEGETVVFPVDSLDRQTRQELETCFGKS